MVTDREKWLEEREGSVGGSDLGTILGLNAWKSAYKLWAEFCGTLEPDDLSDNIPCRVGHELEPLAKRMYTEQTERALAGLGDFDLRTNDLYPRTHVTADDIILPCKGHDGDGILEIKTTGESQAHLWKGGSPPLTAQVQVQHGMMITGCGWGSIGVMIGNREFAWVDVKRNDEFIERVSLPAIRAFLKLVDDREAPPVDESESTAAAIKALYPKDDATTAILPESAIAVTDRIVELKARRKTDKTELTGRESTIKELIGDSTFGDLPDGLWTWRQHDVAERTTHYPPGTRRPLLYKGK